MYLVLFTREKNIPFILDVIAKLPDEFELTLVGYGSYIDYLTEYAYKKLTLSPDRIRFIIKPDKQALLALYRSAHLFLFPSQSDTQGLVLAESMASSTPVIALDGMGQRDIIRSGKNGFIVHDRDEMREKIMATVQDEQLYHQLQCNAWQTAQAYDPKELVKKALSLYEKKS